MLSNVLEVDTEKPSLENVPANLYESVCVPDLGEFMGYQGSTTSVATPEHKSPATPATPPGTPQSQGQSQGQNQSQPPSVITLSRQYHNDGKFCGFLKNFYRRLQNVGLPHRHASANFTVCLTSSTQQRVTWSNDGLSSLVNICCCTLVYIIDMYIMPNENRVFVQCLLANMRKCSIVIPTSFHCYVILHSKNFCWEYGWKSFGESIWTSGG